MSERSGQVSGLLQQWVKGDQEALDAVQMKFFGGLSASDISQVLGISLATVEREWATARSWLRREMGRAASP
jgi:DNA-directed RNA polymerase specialized sigma24 family protein